MDWEKEKVTSYRRTMAKLFRAFLRSSELQKKIQTRSQIRGLEHKRNGVGMVIDSQYLSRRKRYMRDDSTAFIDGAEALYLFFLTITF